VEGEVGVSISAVGSSGGLEPANCLMHGPISFLLSAILLLANVPGSRGNESGSSANPDNHEVHHQAGRDYRNGVRFADGAGDTQNYLEAARHYRQAAEKGFVPAQYSLACLYENGLGVRQDATEAEFWYRKAALKGEAESQVNLGVLYATGTGVARDDAEAVRWYRMAAEQRAAYPGFTGGCARTVALVDTGRSSRGGPGDRGPLHPPVASNRRQRLRGSRFRPPARPPRNGVVIT
jgi:Sel1 repeat